jgi:internalin A
VRCLNCFFACYLVVAIFSGCDGDSSEEAKSAGEPSAVQPEVADSTGTVGAESPAMKGEGTVSPPLTEEGLRAALKKANPGLGDEIGIAADGGMILAVEAHDRNLKDIGPFAGLPLVALDLARSAVKDITPLQGMPLRELYLEETAVDDISPLEGAPLEKLYLSQTNVEDLTPLKKAIPLKELNLVGTKVTDLSPLEGLPRLELLWLSECPVQNVAPLARVRSLVSLTVENTQVEDLSHLEGHPLLRLHIGQTPVADLTPLRSMQLTRLVFTPSRIKKGMEYARNMRTLREMGTEFSDPQARPLVAPAEFWAKYDAGDL